ncbi:hypothetical protein Taro_045087, partial [Colocasia esculenta]|nr:hypothetical protein [Colocasia esculenta]
VRPRMNLTLKRMGTTRSKMWYRWDRTPQMDKEMLQHMKVIHKGCSGMLKLKHYKGKTFEDVVTSITAGVRDANGPLNSV